MATEYRCVGRAYVMALEVMLASQLLVGPLFANRAYKQKRHDASTYAAVCLVDAAVLTVMAFCGAAELQKSNHPRFTPVHLAIFVLLLVAKFFLGLTLNALANRTYQDLSRVRGGSTYEAGKRGIPPQQQSSEYHSNSKQSNVARSSGNGSPRLLIVMSTKIQATESFRLPDDEVSIYKEKTSGKE
ncbi:hypothetical protein Ancab_020344 [Ancistrocladus abbreviatus]